MKILIGDNEQMRAVIQKCCRLFDCYAVPPEADGVQLTHAYLEENLYYRDSALILCDTVSGGVYGDIAGQIFRIFEKNGLLKPDTPIEYGGKTMTFEAFLSGKPKHGGDMAIAESTDDPDSDCFRSRKHLLDTFWEGCIEQNPEWDQDD